MAVAEAPLRVDAHHHFWRLARGDYGWMTPDLPIYRDYGLDDLRPLLGEVTATVLVQAAPTEAETGFMLDTARASAGLVRAVVGWTDLASPIASTRIAALAGEAPLKGLRPMLQDISDTDWVLRDDVRPGLDAMERAGLRLDLLVQSRHLPLVTRLAERHPALPLVVDHAAKPRIADGAWEPWASDIARVAKETPAFCKLSGLVTEAAPDWTVDDLRRYADHLLEHFGPARLLWGSDWPVVCLAGGYVRWREATEALIAGLAGAERDAVLGGTAARFYGFEEVPC